MTFLVAILVGLTLGLAIAVVRLLVERAKLLRMHRALLDGAARRLAADVAPELKAAFNAIAAREMEGEQP